MASTGVEENDDLTTDAVPSRPRDEQRNFERIPDPDPKERRESTHTDEEEHEKRDENPSSNTGYRIPKSKPKKSASKVTNVINISNANGIHIGTNVNMYLNKNEPSRPKPTKNIQMSESIRKLLNRKECVTKKEILDISGHIDEGWRDTARLLDYSDGQISQFYDGYKSAGPKEVIYQFLLDWLQNNAEAATADKLSSALWESNQKEAVHIWSQKIFSN